MCFNSHERHIRDIVQYTMGMRIFSNNPANYFAIPNMRFCLPLLTRELYLGPGRCSSGPGNLVAAQARGRMAASACSYHPVRWPSRGWLRRLRKAWFARAHRAICLRPTWALIAYRHASDSFRLRYQEIAISPPKSQTTSSLRQRKRKKKKKSCQVLVETSRTPGIYPYTWSVDSSIRYVARACTPYEHRVV